MVGCPLGQATAYAPWPPSGPTWCCLCVTASGVRLPASPTDPVAAARHALWLVFEDGQLDVDHATEALLAIAGRGPTDAPPPRRRRASLLTLARGDPSELGTGEGGVWPGPGARHTVSRSRPSSGGRHGFRDRPPTSVSASPHRGRPPRPGGSQHHWWQGGRLLLRGVPAVPTRAGLGHHAAAPTLRLDAKPQPIDTERSAGAPAA